MIYLIFPKLHHPALVLERHSKVMVTDVILCLKILIETHICKYWISLWFTFDLQTLADNVTGAVKF